MHLRGVLCLGIAAALCTSCKAPTTETDTDNSAASGILSMRVKRTGPPPEEPQYPERKSDEQQFQDIIDAYEADVTQHPDEPDNEAKLLALGNLYRMNKRDPVRAAQWYREWADAYATAGNAQSAMVLAELVSLYEELGDEVNRREMLRRMISLFPEDSEQFRYAEKLIKGEEATREPRRPAPDTTVPVEGAAEAEGIVEGESAPEVAGPPSPVEGQAVEAPATPAPSAGKPTAPPALPGAPAS